MKSKLVSFILGIFVGGFVFFPLGMYIYNKFFEKECVSYQIEKYKPKGGTNTFEIENNKNKKTK